MILTARATTPRGCPGPDKQITQAINAILAGAHPSLLANIPFPALAAHPLSSRLPPQVMQVAQAGAEMQARAIAAMQSAWNSPGAFGGPPGAGAGVFNPNAPAFQPGTNFRAGGGGGGRPPMGGGGGGGGPGGIRHPPHHPHHPAAGGPPVVLPTKPTQDSICKHGVDCARPQCPYSHPSPVATKESGLVLSNEACEKQLKCEDKVRVVFSFSSLFAFARNSLTNSAMRFYASRRTARKRTFPRRS